MCLNLSFSFGGTKPQIPHYHTCIKREKLIPYSIRIFLQSQSEIVETNCTNADRLFTLPHTVFLSSPFSSISLARVFRTIPDLGAPFFPGGPELWHHPLAYSAASAADLPGAAALQHATLVHPALHPQVPVRSYL